MALAPAGCCLALDALYKLKRRKDAGMMVNDRLIKGGSSCCKTWVAGTLVALILSVGIACAETHLNAITLHSRLDISSAAPKILSLNDVDLYREIFRIQEDGHWRKANTLIDRLDDPLLLGHVLAQRFLHPTKYRSRFKELKDWMAIYADHPNAARLYKLALRRKPKNWRNPKPPARIRVLTTTSEAKSRRIKGRKLSRANRSKVRNYKRHIYRVLRRGHTLAAKRTLQSQRVKQLFSHAEFDQARAKLGQVYFNDGRDKLSLEWAGQAAHRSGHLVPDAHWTAGLAAWRLGFRDQSAAHFENAARHSSESEWFHAAAAFWAARANLVARRPDRVNKFLEEAAAKPRTFYGLLALHVLGRPLPFKWTAPGLDETTFDALMNRPRGRRAMALLQIDQPERASRELHALTLGADETLSRGVLTLAAQAGMADLAVRLNARLHQNGGGFDGAAYPIPAWEPAGGFRVDRALIYALIRQESRFNPKAKSWAGARGLMQLMPRTARFVARTTRMRYNNRRKLFQPEINLTLGQHYIEMLMKNAKINGGLFLMLAAWNGGPGNLNKWRRRTDDLGDPLFFIESLPSRETRNFIEHVLANLWIYRHRLGQPRPSLAAIAEGNWPVYTPLGQNALEEVASSDGTNARN